MINQSFDQAFADLLKAFKTHEDNRTSGAATPALARSSHELFKARMNMYTSPR